MTQIALGAFGPGVGFLRGVVAKKQQQLGDSLMRTFIAMCIAIGLAGCATQKTLQATGGSKADGTVKLSYEVGMFEKPVVDWSQGTGLAQQRCRAWGYASAEPFGGTITTCQQRNGFGDCIDAIVTAEYQCTGSADVVTSGHLQ